MSKSLLSNLPMCPKFSTGEIFYTFNQFKLSNILNQLV